MDYETLDNAISSFVFDTLKLIGIDINNVSPVTKDLPLVISPTPAILLVVAYLLIVYTWSSFLKSKTSNFRKDESKSLKNFILFHNLFLCGLSFYMGTGIAVEIWKNGYTVFGNFVNPKEVELGFYIYLFYVSKFYEFVDTIIMLLKGNLRQISYLHVYHHASISLIWWVMAYRCPGGDAYFSALFNSWIHVIMYLYYLLAALIGKDEKKRRKYLFWGKYLTMLQMIQFMSFIVQSVYGMIFPAAYPPGICRLLFFYSLSLLLFFWNFFFQKYGKQH